MKNNDINRLLDILEETERRELSELMTEGFDQWCQRRQRRRQAAWRMCIVLLLLVSASAIAVTTVPSLRRIVFPTKEASEMPLPTTPTSILAPTQHTEIDIPSEPVKISYNPVVAVPEPEAEMLPPEPVELPQIPRYDFRYVTPSSDTMGCLLAADGHSVAVACIAANSDGHICVPEWVERNGERYDVTALADSAFFSMTSLRSVILPATLTHVGKDAFAQCSGLDTLMLLASVPPVVTGEWCFFGVPDTAHLLVPCGSANDYSAAPQWDGFEHVVDPCEPHHETMPEVTIIVNGNTIIVEGVDDETVDVYDAQGRLVATAQCKGRCSLIINRDDVLNRGISHSGSGSSAYWVQVGSRPRHQVFLGIKHDSSRGNLFVAPRSTEISF